MIKFGKKYFTSGNYENYLDRKIKYENLSVDLSFIRKLGAEKILDFGCGVGFLTSGLCGLGFNCTGYDKSKWAIKYGINNLKVKITDDNKVLTKKYDCVIALDVLEHNTIEEIKKILAIKTNFLIVRIPVKKRNKKNYHLSTSRKDKTHITCMDKIQWRNLFSNNGFIELSKLKKETIWDSVGVYCALLKKNDKS
jgi:SAM-dependent methyltransferase